MVANIKLLPLAMQVFLCTDLHAEPLMAPRLVDANCSSIVMLLLTVSIDVKVCIFDSQQHEDTHKEFTYVHRGGWTRVIKDHV